jgi:hypothetical protein
LTAHLTVLSSLGMRLRFLTIAFLLAALLVPSTTFAAFNPNFVISDKDLTTIGMSRAQIQSFLERQTGALATYTVQIDGVTHRASDVIYDASVAAGINPKYLLVLLQKEQSLISDPTPSEDQLFWATGYGVCDSCSKTDPAVKAKGGFVNQVKSGASRITTTYFPQIDANGQYLGWGPGVKKTITCIRSDSSLCATGSSVSITPENKATAAMYIYTPHLHGNYNVWRLWNQWFRNLFPDGVIVSVKGASYYLLQGGVRRRIDDNAINSWTSGNSRLPVVINRDELDKYDAGAPLHFARRQLVQVQKGGVYLIQDTVKRAITSRAAFVREGFSQRDVIKKTEADVALYTTGDPITTESMYPAGRLLQSKQTGAVYYVQDGVSRAFYSRAILKANFPGAKPKKVEQAELDLFTRGMPMPFPDGSLVTSATTPGAVYLVSNGSKLPIANPETMKTYGFRYNQIVKTDNHSLEAMPTGAPLDTTGTE